MNSDKQLLLKNFNKISTTELGISRIKRNLKLDVDDKDVVCYCKKQIIKSDNVYIKGKNFYVTYDDNIYTINKNSYNIITAHIL